MSIIQFSRILDRLINKGLKVVNHSGSMLYDYINTMQRVSAKYKKPSSGNIREPNRNCHVNYINTFFIVIRIVDVSALHFS
jgi:hypothetical protein